MSIQDKIITDKKFLKQNDLALLVKQGWQFCKDYKLPLSLVGILILIFLVALPSYRLYQKNRAEKFSEALYSVQTVQDKEKGYLDLLKTYSDLPAVRLVSLRLADHYLATDQKERVLSALEDGLKNFSETDILSTLLVLKTVNFLKKENRFEEIAQKMEDFKKKVLPNFQAKFELLQANLLAATGKSDQAKAMYESLANQNVQPELDQSFDPFVVKEAKDQLLLLEMDVL